MSRIHVTALLALSALVAPTSTAFAQSASNTGHQGRVHEDQDLLTCVGATGGSRARSNCDPEATTVRTEIEVKVPIGANAQPSEPQCEATVLTEYLQRNTIARVETTISPKNCPAGSTGTYDIVVRIRDESGEIKPLEFGEKWQRSDDQAVRSRSDYPIGKNVELVSARVRNLRCTCGDPAPPTQTSTASDN